MHLIGGVQGSPFLGSYHSTRPLTRPNTLSHVFRKLRQHRNLTKRTLAELFSVSEQYVSDVENASRFPSLTYCLKCADLFGANPNWIKIKWADEALKRYKQRLYKRIGLDQWGGET